MFLRQKNGANTKDTPQTWVETGSYLLTYLY